MKTMLPDTNPPPAQPSFAKVAECLHRTESSGIYYALVKRHSKQFRRSLTTADRQLANRRLADLVAFLAYSGMCLGEATNLTAREHHHSNRSRESPTLEWLPCPARRGSASRKKKIQHFWREIPG